MVESVERDSRGIVDPATMLERNSLDRFPPDPRSGRFVDRYWVASWRLPPGQQHEQGVLPHPVVNVVIETSEARVYGPSRRLDVRRLSGTGRAIGIMFRPAGFRPFLGRSVASIVERSLPVADVLGPTAGRLVDQLRAAPDPAAMAALADEYFSRRTPAEHQPCEDLADLIEKVVSDPQLTRVDEVAGLFGCSVRQLQRRFLDEVGIGPKWVIRRYRLYEAAERAVRGDRIDWAALAAELGYSDQAHLTREFTAALGVSPSRYAQRSGRLPPEAPAS